MPVEITTNVPKYVCGLGNSPKNKNPKPIAQIIAVNLNGETKLISPCRIAITENKYPKEINRLASIKIT